MPPRSTGKKANDSPPESVEHKHFASWLDAHAFIWFHPTNEGNFPVQYRIKLARMGLKPGVPDFLIFNPSPVNNYKGLAIELKRIKGGRVSEKQERWLKKLSACGWLAVVAKGCDHAIQITKEHYGWD